MIKFSKLVIAASLCGVSMFAADMTGTWGGVVNLPQNPNAKGGPQAPLPFVVHIKQDGNTIAGKMDGIAGAPDVEIQNGKVDGNALTYEGVRKINNADVKFLYTGTLSGEKLDIKIVRADGNGAPLSSSTTRLTTVN